MKPFVTPVQSIHFKTMLNVKSVYSNLQIVLPYYIKGDRKLSVIHAHLRNNCSNLKHDLYRNFVEPDFSCRCGYSCEDANHYFFICSLYLNERVELFHSTVSYHPLSLRTFCLEIRISVLKITSLSLERFADS